MKKSKNSDKNVGINDKEKVQKNSSVDTDNDQTDKASSKDIENDLDKENIDNQEDYQDEIQDEVKDLKDQLLRTLAENENLRKRTAKEIEQIKKYGHISLLRDLLNVVDNLERAVKSSTSENQSETGTKGLINGIEIVLKEMSSILEKNQIKKIEPLHEKFDYNFHQAMFETPSSDYDEGLIVEVVQPGYILHDRLVRPAMVGVSKGQIKKNDKNEEKNE